MKGFQLHVQDFGKIKNACIDIAPVTFLIGDNNSGKSYLMALMYGLLNLRLFSTGYDLCRDSDEYNWCESWVQSLFPIEPDSTVVPLTDDAQKQFLSLLNLILMRNRNKLTHTVFNSPVDIGVLSVNIPLRANCYIRASVSETENGFRYRLLPKLDGWSYMGSSSSRINTPFFICAILEFLLKADFKFRLLNSTCFLPTSRTGFLLTYKSLVQSTISDAYDISETVNSRTALTRPCTDFLKNLATISIEERGERFQSVVEFIEQNIMGGHVLVSDETPQTIFRYNPYGTDSSLPMQLTSGVVTEVTPLLLLLQFHSNMEGLFIEEPEMGLHPELQLQMARVLLQIHATGIPVFVTTHSDVILQHINNMLKLDMLPLEQQPKILQKLGFTNADTLKADEIEMYQFKDGNITKLEQGPFGYTISSFNDALRDLLNISRITEGDEDDI